MTEGLDRSGFLGGRLQIWQPLAGYRAGTDPVLLAAAVPAGAGQAVLELGLGVGVASLCLGHRVPGVVLTGIEVQPAYAALATRNAAENGIPLEVVAADIAALPKEMRQRSFDHVIANPPFFPAPGRSAAADAGREAARGETVPLADWVALALKRLRPGGLLTMIQAASRLGDLIRALPPTGGTLIPLAGRTGRDADRVILRHCKGGRAALRLTAPLVLHDGAQHLRDGDDYAPWARACLRDGAALPETV